MNKRKSINIIRERKPRQKNHINSQNDKSSVKSNGQNIIICHSKNNLNVICKIQQTKIV